MLPQKVVKRTKGFSQSEILISICIIGLVSALAIPFVLGQGDVNQRLTLTQRADIENSIEKELANARTKMGLFPRSMKPSDILRSHLKSTDSQQINLASDLPVGCSSVTLPAQSMGIVDSPWRVIISESWDTRADHNDVSRICIHHTKVRNVDKTLTVFREGNSLRTLANGPGQ